MNDQNFYKGNYQTDSADHNGWFLGIFMEGVRKTDKLEIKYYDDRIAGHQKKVSATIECTLILAGSMSGEVDDQKIELNAGEYVVIPAGVPNNLAMKLSDDCKALTIKAPSDPGAKKIVENNGS